MIVVFGSINLDLTARVGHIPRPGETVLSPGYATLFGGKGANQAVAAARALQGTGIPVAMVGRVGDDGFGRAAVANLRANEVATDAVAAGPESTGCAFIAIDPAGENAITVASGANAALAAADLGHAFTAADLLVLQMEVGFDAALAVARRARAAGAAVIWNLAPVPAGFARDALRASTAAATVVVVNAREATAAAALLDAAPQDARAAAAVLAREGDAAVVLTDGADGARIYASGACPHHARAPAVAVVDTTGAGDTFVGVLTAGLAEGLSLTEAVPRACLAGALACGKAGAQTGMPTRSELVAATPAS